MKSEHRHELAENDLEVFINRLRARFAESMEVYGNRIMLWASAVLLLIAASVFYVRNSGSANAQGWAALTSAQSPEDLAGVADAYQGKPVGQWARLNVGEQYLQSGLRLMFTNRKAGVADLEEAQHAFEDVLNEKGISEAVRERALFGMARALETTADGDLKPAIETYGKLIAEFPVTAYKPVVENRLTVLEAKTTQDFYAWFASQDPKPKDRELPKDLKGMLPSPIGTGTSQAPEGGTSNKEMAPKETEKEGAAKPKPQLSVPSVPEFPPKTEGKKLPVKPKPAAEKKPATQKPSAEKSTTEKPATDKPGNGTPAPEKKGKPPAEEKKEVPESETKKPETGSK